VVGAMTARELVLRRIGRALTDVPPDERPDPLRVPRHYRRSGWDAVVVDRFLERVADYGAGTRRGAPAAVGDIVGAILARHRARRNTGTLVLASGAPGQGRRAATLLPDLHVTVLAASQIVAIVPEALERLAASGLATRPLTFVSGPSATSDIEMNRVEGVHGPRRLEIVVLGGHDDERPNPSVTVPDGSRPVNAG